ncbi:hypothetical protein [Streptomyces sp. NPDC001404]|uniref:hypothetical protein n=1 Tax=Streptomyces sp. NPDC001404 TaxID=3364571 RepID=UPI003677E901
MNMKLFARKTRASALALSTAAVVLTGMGTGTAQATAPHVPDPLSSEQKTVVLDPATGAVLSVSAGRRLHPSIGNNNICNSGDGCYYSGQIPYANQGFYGSAGTAYGSWPYRSAWDTGDYTASACWEGACSQNAFGPHTYVNFNGQQVTGTSFTIY